MLPGHAVKLLIDGNLRQRVAGCPQLAIAFRHRGFDNQRPRLIHALGSLTSPLIQGTIAQSGCIDRVHSGCKMIASDTFVLDQPHGKESRDAPAPGAVGASHWVQLLPAEVPGCTNRVHLHPAVLFILGFLVNMTECRKSVEGESCCLYFRRLICSLRTSSSICTRTGRFRCVYCISKKALYVLLQNLVEI